MMFPSKFVYITSDSAKLRWEADVFRATSYGPSGDGRPFRAAARAVLSVEWYLYAV